MILVIWGRLGGKQTSKIPIETVITDLFDGQYKNPVRVVAFNTFEGWSREVSEDLAGDLQQRCVDHMLKLPAGLQEFVERYGRPGLEARSSRKCNQRPAGCADLDLIGMGAARQTTALMSS